MSDKSIATVATMGIDIGKNSVHVVGLDQRGAEPWKSHPCPESCRAGSGRQKPYAEHVRG
jgi:hypothetical protein